VASTERNDAAALAPTVGIIGAGQLARMLAESASELGIRTVVLAERPDDAAVETCGEVIVGSPRDLSALRALAARCDVVTLDHELVDLAALAGLEAQGRSVRPGPMALAVAVDKAEQRTRFAQAGIPVPRFVVLDGELDADLAALERFADDLGATPVVKAARGGYDGRGVVVSSSFSEAADAARAWRAQGTRVVAEAPVAFRRELAALVARRPGGEHVAWRTVETAQVDGMCREVRVPGGVDDETSRAAARLALEVANGVGVVGVLAVELFDTPEGLVVNEVAMRPHNSGHWTIEGSVTSQFENHLRAVCDLPLGATSMLAAAVATVNVLGAPEPPSGDPLAVALGVDGAKVHLYGKSPRPGRKLGHVTVTGSEPGDVGERAWRAARALGTPRPNSEEERP